MGTQGEDEEPALGHPDLRLQPPGRDSACLVSVTAAPGHSRTLWEANPGGGRGLQTVTWTWPAPCLSPYERRPLCSPTPGKDLWATGVTNSSHEPWRLTGAPTAGRAAVPSPSARWRVMDCLPDQLLRTGASEMRPLLPSEMQSFALGINFSAVAFEWSHLINYSS